MALACSSATVARATEEARVTLLHTTDLHGSLTAFDYPRDHEVNRGLVKLARLVNAARAEGTPTLLVDAGDAIEGGIEIPYRMGPQRLPDPMIAAMNAMHYDAMTVGNHEFDLGWNALENDRQAARFPWLGANVLRSRGGRPVFVPSIVRQAGPLRIGVIGVCTPAVPRFVDSTCVRGLRFEDPVTAARREAQRLRVEERCDAVVLVAHTGLERDPRTGIERRGDTPDENWGTRLAMQVPGVDVLVLGHTHTVIASAEIQGVLVTQAGRWAEQLGRVDLVFTRRDAESPWRLTGRRAQVIAVDDSVKADPALAALALPYDVEARTLLAQRVGSTTHAIDAPAGRLANGPAWELIHRAQLAATGADVSLTALPDPTVRIPAGPITRGDLVRLYPYGNTLDVVEMTGAELRATLEQTARFFNTYDFSPGASLFDSGLPGYNFDSAYGLDYALDLTRAPGSRVTNLTFKGIPVMPAQRFKVAVNSYRMNGGGDYETVRRARRLRLSPTTVPMAIATLLRTSGPQDRASRAFWTVLPDYAQRPERPLVDRLVHAGLLPADAVTRLGPGTQASRHDVERWITQVFGTPASLELGLVARSGFDAAVANSTGSRGDDGVTRDQVAEACVRAAVARGYAGLTGSDGAPVAAATAAFRRSLTTGTLLAAADVPLTRIQALAMVSNARLPSIRVLETTDFHGQILPGPADRRTHRVTGGSSALAAAIGRLRAENPDGTVLIDGGDLFQGTMISNLQFGRPVVEQMNVLGYTAAAVGNHEFDWGVDSLIERVHEMHFVALAANLRDRATGTLPNWVRSDTTVTRLGARVSVLGLCFRFTPTVTLAKNVAAYTFLDDSTTAAQRVPQLRAASDVVVGVGHIPAETDSAHHLVSGDLKRLAGVAGVDAWFGGHSHNLILDKVGDIPVAIAGSHGWTIAVCDLTVDPVAHKVIERHCELRTVYDDEGIDSTMAQRVERWNGTVAPISNLLLGQNVRKLFRNRGGESTIGNFVCDAIREAAKVDIAFQNSGGLRADLAPGPITKGAIYEIMPFDNRVFTLKLTGADIKLALEQGLRTGRVTQVSGIKYAFDSSAPELHRLTSVTLMDGSPIVDTKPYSLAINDFMATGGDEYDVLSGGTDRTMTDLLIRDTMEQMVANLTARKLPLDYDDSGRITKAGSRKEEPELQGTGAGH